MSDRNRDAEPQIGTDVFRASAKQAGPIGWLHQRNSGKYDRTKRHQDYCFEVEYCVTRGSWLDLGMEFFACACSNAVAA